MNTTRTIITLSLLLLPLSFTFAQFNPPRLPPTCSTNDPNCAVPAPLHLGTITQKKTGSLIFKKNIPGDPLKTNTWTPLSDMNDGHTYSIETNARFGGFEFSGLQEEVLKSLKLPFLAKVISYASLGLKDKTIPMPLCTEGEYGTTSQCPDQIMKQLVSGLSQPTIIDRKPKVSLSWNYASGSQEAINLSWTGTNVDVCEPLYGHNFVTDSKSLNRNGPQNNINLGQQSRRYVIMCYSTETGLSAMDSVFVPYNNPNPPAPPTLSVSSAPIAFVGSVDHKECNPPIPNILCPNIIYPDPKPVTYTVQNASYCSFYSNLGTVEYAPIPLSNEDKNIFSLNASVTPYPMPTANGANTIMLNPEDKYSNKYSPEARTTHSLVINCYNSAGVGVSKAIPITHEFFDKS